MVEAALLAVGLAALVAAVMKNHAA